MAGSKIVITAGLSIPESVNIIEKDLKGVSEKLTADKALKIVCNIDLNKTTQRIQSQLATISKNLSLNIPKISTDIDAGGSREKINAIAKDYAAGSAQADVLHRKQDLLKQDYDILAEKIKKVGQSIDSIATKGGVNYDKVFTDIMGKDNVDADSLNRARDALSSIRKEFQLLNEKMGQKSAAETLSNRISKASAALADYASKNKMVVGSTKTMSDGLTTFSEKWNYLVSQMQRGKAGKLSADEFKHLNEEIVTFKKEADAAGLSTSALFKNMGVQLRQVIGQWVSLNAAIYEIRKMVNYVIELDNAMTKLKRVTNETAEGYANFFKEAQKSAEETHTTLIDTVEQAAKWAKSGYNATESAQLARTSLIYSIVGDIDNDTAVSDMVTALRGFDMKIEESMSIVDKLDALNNNFATSAKDLGAGLKVSASALNMGGNDINQALALITGGAEITQNAQEMGNALKIITMRIKGMKGELQELGEESEGIEAVSKIQTQILNLTKGKVNIFDGDNNFRATYDILKDISEVYNELSDPQKADLTEILFGKLRGNQGLAIIKAFQSGQIEKAYETAAKSAGTAEAEMDKYSESIAAHMTDFKTAVQQLSKDLVNSDFLKGLVDTGTTFVKLLDKIIDKVGVLPTILTSLAAVGSFKGKGKPNRICLFTHRCDICA